MAWETFDDPPGTKTCRKCRVRKDVAEFAQKLTMRDGLTSWCKDCKNKATKERSRAKRAAERALRPQDPPIPAGMKRCGHCRELRQISDFDRNRVKPDGRDATCKDCRRAARGRKERYIDPAPDEFATCRTCGTVKPRGDFYREPRMPRGVTASCKACRLARDAAKRRDRGAKRRERFEDPPGTKTCRRCRVRKPSDEFRPYPRNTADGLASYCNDCGNEVTLEWHRRNPATILRLRTERRTLEESVTLLVTDRDLTRLRARWGHRCAYCGQKHARMQLDHVVPLARGGRHSIGNLLPACADCNLSKRAKLLTAWRRAAPRVTLG